jgi:hypothetical protein
MHARCTLFRVVVSAPALHMTHRGPSATRRVGLCGAVSRGTVGARPECTRGCKSPGSWRRFIRNVGTSVDCGRLRQRQFFPLVIASGRPGCREDSSARPARLLRRRGVRLSTAARLGCISPRDAGVGARGPRAQVVCFTWNVRAAASPLRCRNVSDAVESPPRRACRAVRACLTLRRAAAGDLGPRSRPRPTSDHDGSRSRARRRPPRGRLAWPGSRCRRVRQAEAHRRPRRRRRVPGPRAGPQALAGARESHLVESVGKKCEFLRRTADAVGLANVSVVKRPRREAGARVLEPPRTWSRPAALARR